MPSFIPLSELKMLFDYGYVINNKINTIKTLRTITNEGLKEAKDFLEQTLIPALEHQNPLSPQKRVLIKGSEEHSDQQPGVVLPPPMYLVGHSYKQRNKNTVLILGVSNFNTYGETVYSIDSDGSVVHRYNRRDFGRVTGTDQNDPDPRNLVVL